MTWLREKWGAAPAPVRVALVLMIVSALLGILIAMFRTSPAQLGPIAVIIGLAVIAAFLSRILVGRNWARIVVTLLTVLALFSQVADIGTGLYAYTLLDHLVGLPSIAAAILLWLPASMPHFRRKDAV